MQITPERRKGGWASRYGGLVVLLSPTSLLSFFVLFRYPSLGVPQPPVRSPLSLFSTIRVL